MRSQGFRWLLVIGLVLGVVLMLGATSTWAQTVADQSRKSGAQADPAAAELAIQRRLRDLEANPPADEELGRQLGELYRKASQNLASAKEFQAATESWLSSLEPEADDTGSDATSASVEGDLQLDVPAGLPPEELERLLTQAKMKAEVFEEQSREVTRQLDATYSNPGRFRGRLVTLRRGAAEVQAGLTSAGVSAAEGELAQARRWERESLLEALQAEARMLERRLELHDVYVRHLLSRREEISSGLEASTARVEGLIERIQSQQAERADADLAQAKISSAELGGSHQVVRKLAQENVELAQLVADDAKLLGGLAKTSTLANAELARVETWHRGARLRMEAVGMSPALGEYLLEKPTEPERILTLAKARSIVESRMSEKALLQLRHSEELEALQDLDGWIGERLAKEPSEPEPEVRASLHALALDRRKLLERAVASDDLSLRLTGDLIRSIEELESAARSYDAFVARHLLWVRTAGAFDRESLPEMGRAAVFLFSPTRLRETVAVFWTEALRSLLVVPLMLIAILIFASRRRWRRRLEATAERVGSVERDSIVVTLKAILWTLVLALPLPLTLATLGRGLGRGPEATVYTQTLGGALVVGAGLAFLLRFVGWSVVAKGLAERHFLWHSRTRDLIHRVFGWATVVLVPLATLAALLRLHPEPLPVIELRRAVLLILLLAITYFLWVLLDPRRGVLMLALQLRQDGWLNRTRVAGFAIALSVPLILALLDVLGYVQTASLLLQASDRMLLLVVLLVLLHQTVIRWLMVIRRRLRFAEYEARQGGSGEGVSAESELDGAPAEYREELATDFVKLDVETRQLVNAATFVGALAGLWFIWSEVLPALGFLDQTVLWHHTGVIDGITQPIPVTLADLLRTLFIGVVAYLAARHLPALMEILLLQARSITSGARYALIKLARYSVVTLAMVLVLSGMGFSWSQLQWLVAALGVGIGFGLQEIVANFISGLIVLFERPIQVGDFVTVGDTSGTVTRINIRATTIRNFDQQELLVPNREFITNRLLNWTLSDRVNRITIKVGIEYGSDVQKAMDLLRDAAESNQWVMEEPAPVISFEGFGDDSLQLILRCYLETLEHRIEVITELHQSVERLFREAGIGIAFPQRDVHLSARDPIRVRLEELETGDSEGSPLDDET